MTPSDAARMRSLVAILSAFWSWLWLSPSDMALELAGRQPAERHPQGAGRAGRFATARLHERSQTWKTFLGNHAKEIYACDFLVQWTATFRMVYVFVVMELGSRRVVHANVTSSPTLAWVKGQIRELSAWGSAPRFLIHD